MQSRTLMMAALFFSAVSGASTASDHFTVEIDKGELFIELAALNQPYELDYSIPENCESSVETKRAAHGIYVRHSDAYCPKGASFNLKLNQAIHANVQLMAGAIKVRNPLLWTHTFDKITIEVKNGALGTTIPGIRVLRMGYTGSKGVYRSDNPSGRPIASLRVHSGAIDF